MLQTDIKIIELIRKLQNRNKTKHRNASSKNIFPDLKRGSGGPQQKQMRTI